jgi:uncharacterized protein involved in exopolysaccharide biosynthesis
METQLEGPTNEVALTRTGLGPANWVENATVLWEHRRLLARAVVISLVAGLLIAFLIPKKYTSTGRIMPPDNGGSSVALLAALTGHGSGEMGGLGSLAGSLLGVRNSSALFVDLLRSGTVSGDLIERFQLQHAWHKRYKVDAAKYLARHTSIVDDKRSGVITVAVEDSDPRRARDLAQAYMDELNKLVVRTSTSSARQERIFIEKRLQGAAKDLKQAEVALSDFSSTHTAIDIPEQTRAMVDAGARLQAEEITARAEVDSLRQIYGDTNVRVRAAQARAAEVERQLAKMGGAAEAAGSEAPNEGEATDQLYPSLRQLPRLAVPYAELYRRVRVQEAVCQLLTQEYEVARIQEAKDVPVVSVIDAPGIPEKKSFPPRTLLTLLIVVLGTSGTALLVLFRQRWNLVDEADPRKLLTRDVVATVRRWVQRARRGGGAL